MHSGSGYRLFFAVVIFSLTNLSLCLAQVSLLPEHTITVEGFTLIRDIHNASRWYYAPERPYLFERNPSNSSDPKPVFQLITYQAKKDAQLFEGGVLQFSLSMNLAGPVKQRIEKALRARYEDINQKEFSLAPLPYHKAEAILFNESGKKFSDGTQAPGIAPAFVTGVLPFQLKLDKFGTDLYSALIDSANAGVGVLMNLTFEGQLPPAGFKVTIDWDQTFKHLSNSSETRISIGNYFCGIDIGINKTKIREELISKACLKVESLTNEVVSDEMIDRYLDPVLARMQKTVIAKINPPEKIDTSSRNRDDSLGRCFFAGKSSINIEMRDIKKTVKGTETFTFDQSVIVERKTACGAFIGINSYSEDVKKNLIRAMPLDSWASAFLLLPGVENNPELHINSVSMTANVIDSKGKPVNNLSDTARWSIEEPLAWKNKDGEDTSSLKFPLMALFKKHNNKIDAIRKEYNFKVDVIIEQKFGNKLNTLETSYLSPVFDGDLPLPPSVDLVDNIVFDTSALTFNNSSGLKKVKIIVDQPGKDARLEYTFPHKNNNENSVVFIVEAAKEGEDKKYQLIPTITFDSATKRNLAWQHNGKDLRATDPALYFIFFDSDWMIPEN